MTGGRGGQGGTAGTAAPSLYQKYATYFPIGAAVDASSYTTHAAVLTKHFNSIVAEDQMKFDALDRTRAVHATAPPIGSCRSRRRTT